MRRVADRRKGRNDQGHRGGHAALLSVLAVVVTLQTLGSAHSNHGSHHAAIESFERAVDIGGQLLVRWPEQPQYRRDYVVSQNHLGLELSRTGKLAESCDAFREALAYQRALQKDFPSDAETQSMLGGVLNNLGFVLQQLGERDQAIIVYREAEKCQSTAVGLAPQVARYQTYLAKHRFNLSHLEAL